MEALHDVKTHLWSKEQPGSSWGLLPSASIPLA